MDTLCKCMFIIIETIVNIMKTRHFSKVIDVCSKNLIMSIRHMKKEMQCSQYFSFFALSNLLTQTCLHFCRTGQLTSSEHAKCILFIITFFFCLFLPTHCILMQLNSQ